MRVTILFLITIFFFHLNLSSSDVTNLQVINYDNEIVTTQPIDFTENWHTGEVNLRMDNYPETNYLTFELSNRCIYPSETIFREYIAPTLNSKKICSLYKFFQSKNPSISHQKFLPPERFFKSYTVLTMPKLEQKILYKFKFDEKTPFSKFQSILYNPTNKTLETIEPNFFDESVYIPEGHFIANIGEDFFPFRSELNTKPLHDDNKTVMIATNEDNDQFFLILEDSTDKNLKQYSVICHGEFEEKRDKSVLLYESRTDKYQRENVEYPEDINFILKAKYMSGMKKYYFKFQYGHIKVFQKVFQKWSSFVEKLIDFSDWVLDHNNTSCKRLITAFFLFYPMYIVYLAKLFYDFSYDLTYPTKLKETLQLFSKTICFTFLAYIWLAPYKAIMGAILSPLYFYYSPQTFFLALNLEPLTPALFWAPTLVHSDLQFSRTEYFQIYPLDQMFVIPTLKTPMLYILLQCFQAWIIMVVLTSFIYSLLPEQNMSGEFME